MNEGWVNQAEKPLRSQGSTRDVVNLLCSKYCGQSRINTWSSETTSLLSASNVVYSVYWFHTWRRVLLDGWDETRSLSLKYVNIGNTLLASASLSLCLCLYETPNAPGEAHASCLG